MRRLVAVTVLSAVALVGCGADGSDGDPAQPTTVSEVGAALDEGAVVIDVRTPSEFATGHVRDALNIDIGRRDFEAKVEALDKGATYVVYCRTGSRAGAAVERMAALGFDELLNGGAFGDLEAAGVPTS